MCCSILINSFVASLIHSYSSIMFICPFLSSGGEAWDVLSLTWMTLVSLFHFSATMWSYAEVIIIFICFSRSPRVLYQPACARSSTFAVWVRHLLDGADGIRCQKVEDTQWTCVCASPGGPSHLSHVPSLLRWFQDPQHSLRGPTRRGNLFIWHQWQCGHVCAGLFTNKMTVLWKEIL